MADSGSNSEDKKTPYAPIGVSGLPRYAGYVFDEWLHELQGPRGRRVIREMSDNSAPIGALKFAMEMLIRQVSWTVAPGKDDDDGHKAADLVFTSLHDMETPFEDTLADILTMIDYGWSLFEQVYKRRDGKASKHDDGLIGWQGWQMRGQETLLRWDYVDYHANFPESFIQLGPPDFREHTIPMTRCLLFRTTTRRSNPEGRSMWRNAYHSWYMAKHLEAIEAIGAERDMAGLPYALIPGELLDPSAPPDQKKIAEAWKDLVKNIRRDEQEGLVGPSDRDETGNLMFELKLLSTGGQRQFDLGAVIERHEQRMLMTCLGDFIMLGHTNVGTQSLGQTKIELFSTAISALLSMIASQINDVAIPRLLKLNGMAVDNPPMLQHGQVERMDLDTLGNFLYQLGQAGFQLDTNPQGALMNHLLEQAHLPPPPEGLEAPTFPDQWDQYMPNPAGAAPGPGNYAPGPTGAQPLPNAPAPPVTPATPRANPPGTGGMQQQVLMPQGPKRPSIKEPNMPNPKRAEATHLPRKALQSNGVLAASQRRSRQLSEQAGVQMTMEVARQLAEQQSLKVVAFDLDNTALRFPNVFVPIARTLKGNGVEVGVITGNPTSQAHEMWDSLGYPAPDFYLVHPQMDQTMTPQWKAQQCKKMKVDVLIDDFSGGRLTGTFRHFVEQENANVVPLEVVLPIGDSNYQQVGKTEGV